MTTVNMFDYYLPHDIKVETLSHSQLILWEKRCTAFLENEEKYADTASSAASEFVWFIIEFRDRLICRLNQLERKCLSGEINRWLLTREEINNGYIYDDETTTFCKKGCGCITVAYAHATGKRAPIHRFYRMCEFHCKTLDTIKTSQNELQNILMS